MDKLILFSSFSLLFFLSEETKGNAHVYVSNSTSAELVVEVGPIKMVRQAELRERNFGVQVGIDLQTGLQFGQGAAGLVTYDTPDQSLSISPHGVWRMPVPRESLVPWKRGKAAMTNNTLQIRVYYKVNFA